MPSNLLPNAAISIVDDDLRVLLGLLSLVARGDPPTRENAVVYATCRARLLASQQGKMLPGFLYQCATIDRFREFIHLYDPEIDLRVHFIRRMIDRARPIEPQIEEEPRRLEASSWEF